MKKRIIALVTAILLTIFCLPLSAVTVSAEPEAPADKPEITTEKSTEYYIVPCHAEDTALDLKAENLKDIQIYKSNDSENQIWTLSKVDEYYVISSKKTGGVIEVSGGNATLGQALEVNTFDGSDKQLWRLDLMEDGSFSIRSKLSETLCWDVAGEGKANGTRVLLWNNAKKSSQRFRFVECSDEDTDEPKTTEPETTEPEVKLDTSAEYSIVPCHAETTALDLKSENRKDIQIYKAKSVENQTWYLGRVGKYYVISCKFNEGVAEVPNGNAVRNQRIEVNSFDGSDKQLWRLELMDDGSYSIHSKLDDSLCWDVEGESKANGARIMLHPQHNNKNQRFRFNVRSTELSDISAQDGIVDQALTIMLNGFKINPCHAETTALDIKAETRKDVQISKSNNSDNQIWQVCRVGDYYTISSKETEGVIEVPNGIAVPGQKLQVNWYDGSDKQLWRLEKTKDGSYLIHSKVDDKLVWDVEDSGTKNLTRLILYPQHNKKNQLFRFSVVSTAMKAWYEEDETFTDSSKNYMFLPSSANTSCVDLSGSDSKTVQLYDMNGGENQSWRLKKVGSCYAFVSSRTGDVIEVPNGSAVLGQALETAKYDGSNKQLWQLEKTSDGRYIVHSKLNDMLVWSVQGKLTDDKTRIVLYPQNNSQNQRFEIAEALWGEGEEEGAAYEFDDFVRYGLDEEYALVPVNAGSSAVDLSDSDGNGKVIHLWKAHHKTNQRWKLKKVGDYYAFVSVSNGKVIDVPNSNASLRTGLVSYDYHGGNNQLWRLESMGDGTYIIHSKLNDNYVWDVRHGTWNDGNEIQLYDITKRFDQRFRFVHLSTIEPMSEWGSSRQDCHGSNWSVWDGSMNTNWYNANSTDQYIRSAADFGGLISLVMNDWDMEGKTIHLMCDINLAENHWTPIGFAGHWFKGSFNGHNHAIIGLNNTHEDDHAALFGYVRGGTICNLAVAGTIKGGYQVGGVVGLLDSGHIVNVYSEISIINATKEREGGIVAACGYGGMVDHCTQNATVNSTSNEGYRGGIAGYNDGHIRYCVNKSTVNQNWNYGGGIAGYSGGVIVFCANHGTVGGGRQSERIGGICGQMNNGFIIGCYNNGTVCSTADDFIGGICGEGRPIKCLNMGVVTGNKKVGAIAGAARDDTPYCYALAWSSPTLHGEKGSRAEWVSAGEIASGKVCYNMSFDDVTSDWYDLATPFTQNIGSDPYPTFGSSRVVWGGNSYINEVYQVKVETDRGYGRVYGGGTYAAGNKVSLKAMPAAGCVFDHFEVYTSGETGWTGWNGSQYAHPTVRIARYNTTKLTLTNNLQKSYTVRAVFKPFDEVPSDMKVTVKLELECTDDVAGWNSDILPIEIVDSAGVKHYWETNRNNIDDKGEKVSHTFDLGAASPVAVHVTPDFGGGLTFRSYGLKARLWVNDSGSAMESGEVMIRSWPFVSSKHNDDYMKITFENYGNSKLGDASYSRCIDAWNAAKNSSQTLRLESAWILDGVLEIGSGQTINLDLNGFPIIRAMKKTDDDGELIKINAGATLNVTDSTPSRKSSGNFTGGSIQGGRSDNTGGLIECAGTLNMKGGTLYNGGTTDKGGAIKLTGSAKASLTSVLISNCWSDKAITYQNEGGAIYMKENASAYLNHVTIRYCRALDYGGGIYLEDDGNKLDCNDVYIYGCSTTENQGAGVYQDHGETKWVYGSIKNCRAGEDNGGGFYQNNGKAYFKEVDFEGNYSEDNGGAFYSDTSDGLWFINCKMTGNRADDHGGALYMTHENLYMENCTVTSNSAGGVAGGLYIDDAITMAGVMVIRGNDGEGSKDNLVLVKGALLYNLGLEPGSEVHLRSKDDGNVKMGGSLMSTYQLEKYFRADYGSLSLTETQTVDTTLRASVFSDGTMALYVGAAVLVIALVGGLIYRGRKKEGGAQ